MLNKMIKKLVFVFAVIELSTAGAEVFKLEGIQIHGLQRLSRETVLSYLPARVKIGEELDSERTGKIIRALYETNFFSDVELDRKGNVLVIKLVERAVIGALKITGNNKLPNQQLTEALKSVGLTEGQELNPGILQNMRQAIVEQYHLMGFHNAKVEIESKTARQNRVMLAIKITEGSVTKIGKLSIVGSKAFSQQQLRQVLTLTETKLWSFFTESDRYAKEKLDADLGRLQTHFMNLGYLKAEVALANLSMTPDGKRVNITIRVTEGPIYRFAKIELVGELLGRRDEFLKLITCQSGQIFSHRAVMETKRNISFLLSNWGYATASVESNYVVDDLHRQLSVKFTVRPNHLVYLRYINFFGNNRTREEVLRREMRMQEGGLFSADNINESARRLANLGYLKDINYEMSPVPGKSNQVDLGYTVKEDSAVEMQLQAGFSNRDGFLYGVSLRDQNIFGTGKAASLRFDNTKANRSYGCSYHDPYFLADKIGLSVNGYSNSYSPHKVNHDLSSYKSNAHGFSAALDMPFSNYTQFLLGLGIEHIGLSTANMGDRVHKEMSSFIEKHGSKFNQFKVFTSLGFSKLDRAIFPTRGFAHSAEIDWYLPMNSRGLTFYKITYSAKYYLPLGEKEKLIFKANGEIGYGDGIGKTEKLPPYKNFYAGGIGTVRGFKADTISSKQHSTQVIGANLLTVASANIIFPNPFGESVRTSLFMDVGSIHEHHFDTKNLRAAYGLQLEWRTPLVPLIFCFAKPIRKKAWDSKDLFQFSLGVSL